MFVENYHTAILYILIFKVNSKVEKFQELVREKPRDLIVMIFLVYGTYFAVGTSHCQLQYVCKCLENEYSKILLKYSESCWFHLFY